MGKCARHRWNFLSIAAALAVWGCAATPTKGTLPRIDKFPIAAKKQSVSFRYLHRVESHFSNATQVNLYRNEKFDQVITDVFNESQLFSEVKNIGSSTKALGFSGKDTPEEKRALEIGYPLKTDLFIDIYSFEQTNGIHSPYAYWGLIHVLTLGIIPIHFPSDLELHATVYRSNGKPQGGEEVKNSSSIWGWSPLFFFNGFKLIRQIDDVQKDNRDAGVRNLLLKLKNAGKL